MVVKDAGIANIREVEFKHDDQQFFVREPTPDDVNNADLLRSKFFFAAIKAGVPTESEIFDVLQKQGRFDQKDYEKELGKISGDLSKIMIEMAKAKNPDYLREQFELCRAKRVELHEHILKRNQFINHCSESKATNDYYTALMGACIFNSSGDPVFGEYDKVTGSINLEKAYEVIKQSSDFRFISICAEIFIPFCNGILNPKEINPEYALYTDMRSKLNLPDDDIVIQFKKSSSIEEDNTQQSIEAKPEVEPEEVPQAKDEIDTSVVVSLPSAKEAIDRLKKGQSVEKEQPEPPSQLPPDQESLFSEETSKESEVKNKSSKEIPKEVKQFEDSPDVRGDEKAESVEAKNEGDTSIGDGSGMPG